MKIKKPKKKIFLPTIIYLILVSILSFLGYYLWQRNKPFSLNSLNLSDWTPAKKAQSFLFPKDNIFILKNFQNSYHLKNDFITKSNFDISLLTNINQNDIETNLNNSNEIEKIDKQLKNLGFQKNENLTGTYPVSDTGSRYLTTYTKGSIYCQIKAIFDCYKNNCATSNTGIVFGCGNFNLQKEFQIQSKYYELLKAAETYQYYEGKPYTLYLSDIKTDQKYHLIIQDLITDVGIFFINNQGKKVCEGKACCDKNWAPETVGDWCTDDYQTIDTYQPIGL